MMAKMFYTMEEAKAALGRSEDDIRQFAREGRLREFRDGQRLMFKADQVEQLKGEMSSGSLDQVDLGVSDSGGLIGLVDTTGASGTSITLSDADTAGSSGSGMGIKIKDDTALAADLGLSGSLGGVPSPGRPGGGTHTGSPALTSGTGLSGSGGTRAGGGINVFGAEDTGYERVDPMAQTNISSGVRDQIDLQGVGSGSGLLDLTRESDDTSLGAVLDEITPANRSRAGSVAGMSGSMGAFGSAVDMGDQGLGTVIVEDETPTPRISAPPVYVQAPDALAPAFGGAALAAAAVLLVGIFVLTSAVVGTRPGFVEWFDGKTLLTIFAMGFGLVALFFAVGLIMGLAGGNRR